VASAGGSSNPRSRGFTHGSRDGSAVSQSSCDLTAVLVSTWGKVPLRGSKVQQKAKKPDNDDDGQAAERVGAEKADDDNGDGEDDEDDNDDEEDARFRAVKTWSAGTKLQRPVSIKVSPASTFDEWMLQSREDTQAVGGESATARPSDSTALLSPNAPAAAGSDDEPGGDGDIIITPRGTRKRRKSVGGGSDHEGSGKKKDRTRKSKSNSSGRERKKAGGKSEKGEKSEKTKKAKPKTKTDGEGKKVEATTKQHKRRKSREKVEAAIVARSGDEEEDSGYVSPPDSPHKYGAIRVSCVSCVCRVCVVCVVCVVCRVSYSMLGPLRWCVMDIGMHATDAMLGLRRDQYDSSTKRAEEATPTSPRSTESAGELTAPPPITFQQGAPQQTT
jgi:hypothetical protein